MKRNRWEGKLKLKYKRLCATPYSTDDTCRCGAYNYITPKIRCKTQIHHVAITKQWHSMSISSNTDTACRYHQTLTQHVNIIKHWHSMSMSSNTDTACQYHQTLTQQVNIIKQWHCMSLSSNTDTPNYHQTLTQHVTIIKHWHTKLSSNTDTECQYHQTQFNNFRTDICANTKHTISTDQ